MKSELAIILFYKRENRYSFNAIAGAMENHTDIKSLDVYFIHSEKDILHNLPTILENHKQAIFGCSFATTQFWDIQSLVKKVKEISKNKIILIAGGPHPTGEPLETLLLGFDIVVRGEGEETFIEIIKKILNKENYNDVKGISYLGANSKYIFTGHRKWLNLDDYSPISEYYSKYGAIEITRGCPFACSFCQTSRIFGIKPRHRSVNNILDYTRLMFKHNLKDFRVITPNAFSYGSEDGKIINFTKLESLLFNVRKILGKDGRIFFGSFPSEVRPEHVNNKTVELVIKYANNDNLVIGAQVGSQRMLDFIHRGHDIQSIYNSVEITLSFGLKANVDFIFGLPNENDYDISLTIKMMKDLAKLGARIHAHTFMPLPQTPLKNYKSKEISPSLRKEINKLASTGILYGDWEKQEKFSQKISSKS